MTAQFTEVLQRHGQNFRMCTEPLGEYFKLAGHKPDFIWPHTGLWLGYIDTWKISEEKLYLVDIDAQYKNGSKAILDRLFPGQPDRVFADWFSGEVRCPQCSRLNDVHGGNESTYERDLLLRFDREELVEKHVRLNSKHDPDTPWPRSANLAHSSPKQTT